MKSREPSAYAQAAASYLPSNYGALHAASGAMLVAEGGLAATGSGGGFTMSNDAFINIIRQDIDRSEQRCAKSLKELEARIDKRFDDQVAKKRWGLGIIIPCLISTAALIVSVLTYFRK